MNRLSLSPWFLLFLLSACGYHLQGKETNLPLPLHSVAIPIFTNQTLQTGIETDVTGALINKFTSSKRIAVTGQGAADALLTGVVKSFQTSPVAVTTSTQVTTEYRATVTVEFTLREQKNGGVLWREEMSEWRNYPVVSDLNATEQNKRAALLRISALLAERVYEFFLGGF